MDISITSDGFKKQAQILREYLNTQEIDISHSKALEAVSKIYGFRDWNTACAKVSDANGIEKNSGADSVRIIGRDGISTHCAFYVSEKSVSYCGWQQVGGSIKVGARSSGILRVDLNTTPYFEPKAVRILGCAQEKTASNRRFMINAVTVGGSPQLAFHSPDKNIEFGNGIISDIFSQKNPLMINWAVFSAAHLKRELKIHVFNINKEDVLVSANLWGNAVTSLDCYA